MEEILQKLRDRFADDAEAQRLLQTVQRLYREQVSRAASAEMALAGEGREVFEDPIAVHELHAQPGEKTERS